MSRRLLIAPGGTAAAPITPTDPDDGLPDPGGDGFPTTTDPIVTLLRPTGVRVTGTATGTPGVPVGNTQGAMYATMEAASLTPYGKEGPDDSGILYLPPGVYRGGFGTGHWQSIVGLGDTPDDVVIFHDNITADGVIHPYAPLYVENLTIKASHDYELDQSPKYCVHIGGSARTTFVNVIFDSTEADTSTTDSTWGGGATVGMDGSPGVNLIFYRCEFYPKGSTVGMNLHGGPLGTPPSRVSFIDCIAPNGVQYSYGAGADNNANPDDELYVIGGTIGGQIVASDNVHVYTNLTNQVYGAGSTNPTVTRNHTDWPTPTSKGLVDFWLNYYYPSGLEATGTTEIKATVTDTAPMTPVAGRTYYCPIPITETRWFNRFGIHGRSGSGAAFGWKASPDKEIYYGSAQFANEPHEDLRAPLTTTGALPAGRMLEQYYDRSWVAFPATSYGGNRMWFAFKMPNTTGVTIDGSAQLPGLHDCYYSDDNGTTLVKATAGTPFPLAHAAQVR